MDMIMWEKALYILLGVFVLVFIVLTVFELEKKYMKLNSKILMNVNRLPIDVGTLLPVDTSKYLPIPLTGYRVTVIGFYESGGDFRELKVCYDYETGNWYNFVEPEYYSRKRQIVVAAPTMWKYLQYDIDLRQQIRKDS